ncbi:MAG: hypothetical protein KKA54_08065 [Proteobacteria bacterium]|nr:hypothetical protein [Pseudomonadota bacterium]
MEQLLDTEIHQEPMTVAVFLHWLAESHMKVRSLQDGILIPWAMLGVGLVATNSTLVKLPTQKQSFTGWIRGEGAREWRGYTKHIILAWKDTFWRAFAFGSAAGVLSLNNGRLCAQGKIISPDITSSAGIVRRAARAIGGTIGAEQDDLRIASALGLEFKS